MSTETKSLEEALQEQEKTARGLQLKRARLAALYEGAKTEKGWAVTPQVAEEIKRLEEECKGLTDQLQAQQLEAMSLKNSVDLDRLLRTPAPDGIRPFAAKQEEGAAENGGSVKAFASLGEALTAQNGFKTWEKQSRNSVVAEIGLKEFDRSLKAPITSTGLTGYERVPGVVGQLQRRLLVRDLLAQGQTERTTIRYLRETTRTSAVDMVAEGDPKPEQLFAFEEVDAPVRKIAGYTKTSDEMLMDYPAIRSFINEQLPFEVLKKEEQQLLSGTGGGQQIEGMLNVTGIQTQALGADTNPDAIYKAITKIRIVFMEPDGVILHPNNWQAIRLLKTTTGEYVWGDPWVPGPDTIFGLPVAVTVAMTANTGLVGAFRRAAQVFFREGVRVEATNTDQDDFVKNLITIRAEERLALAVYYPTGLCTVTGLTA